jgi:hypothetical protein
MSRIERPKVDTKNPPKKTNILCAIAAIKEAKTIGIGSLWEVANEYTPGNRRAISGPCCGLGVIGAHCVLKGDLSYENQDAVFLGRDIYSSDYRVIANFLGIMSCEPLYVGNDQRNFEHTRRRFWLSQLNWLLARAVD